MSPAEEHVSCVQEHVYCVQEHVYCVRDHVSDAGEPRLFLGKLQIVLDGSGGGTSESGPEEENPEGREPEVVTRFAARCPLTSHQLGEPGVLEDGQWSGTLLDSFDAALNEATAHGHSEAFVETFHRA